MGRPERREEKRHEWLEKQIAIDKERDRKARLCMYDRIEECRIDEDTKQILHILAEKAGLE